MEMYAQVERIDAAERAAKEARIRDRENMNMDEDRSRENNMYDNR